MNPLPRVLRLQSIVRLLRLLLLAGLLCGALAGSVRAAVRAVGEIGLTVSNLAAEERFFTEVLPFQVMNRGTWEGEDAARLLGEPAGTPTALDWVRLRLGDEVITLSRHRAAQPRRIPADSRSFDRWFQHIAIVVKDMDAAYAALRQQGIRHVSTGPQTLPAWNTNAAGIRAFYFRDPEDHVLELIWFPPGKGDPKWQRDSARLFLGIDHTAIVVADTGRSLGFYTNSLGFVVAGASENYGVEQEHLNLVFGARLRITALRAPQGPGVELLEYLTPSGGRAYPSDTRVGDLIFWTTRLRVDHVERTVAAARRALEAGASAGPNPSAEIDGPGWNPVTRPSAPAVRGAVPSRLAGEFILRDPDGHALRLEPAWTEAADAEAP